MTYDEIWNVFLNCILEIFPELSSRQITVNDSLRDLGANSVDRAEIIMNALASLKLKIPLINFAQAKNIGELVGIFHQNASSIT